MFHAAVRPFKRNSAVREVRRSDAGAFPHQNGCGNGGIERFRAGRHRNDNGAVTCGDGLFCQPVSLIADYKDCFVCDAVGAERLCRIGQGGSTDINQDTPVGGYYFDCDGSVTVDNVQMMSSYKK